MPAQEVGNLWRDAERLVERGARESQLQQVLEHREVRARVPDVAPALPVPRVRQNRRHLPVVAHGDELPVLSEERGGRQSLGQSHLRRLVHDDQIEMPDQSTARPRRALFTGGSPPGVRDDENSQQQRLPCPRPCLVAPQQHALDAGGNA